MASAVNYWIQSENSVVSTPFVIKEGDDYLVDDDSQLPYKFVRNLGHGQSANVEMVEDVHTGAVFARKRIRISSDRKKRKRIFENEIKIIRRLTSHRHVIRVFATYVTKREVGLILQPVADGGDLEAFLEDYRDLRSTDAVQESHQIILQNAFGCLANGLAFMHSQKIRHKDIKPRNILVHNGFTIYTDFGYSFDYSVIGQSTTTGMPDALTRRYCAPEVSDWGPRNSKSDIFSLGCVFLELLGAISDKILGQELDSCYHENITEILLRLSAVTLEPTRFMGTIISKMLDRDLAARPDATGVVSFLWDRGKHIYHRDRFFCDQCKEELSREEYKSEDWSPTTHNANSAQENPMNLVGTARNSTKTFVDLSSDFPQQAPTPSQNFVQLPFLAASQSQPIFPTSHSLQRTGVLVSRDIPRKIAEIEEMSRPEEERERQYPLNHFIDNVLRLTFPVLEVNQHDSALSNVILSALKSNIAYLRCCLSISAQHLKATNAIMRYFYATISELPEVPSRGTNHAEILEASLGMIFFQCTVGRLDDCLSDIPWHQHFQAASSLVHKLELFQHLVALNELPHSQPPFITTLISWIDILGATTLCRLPTFADTYREKLIADSPSGLAELMGCEDRIMYLISEIVCLEDLKLRKMDEPQLCAHIKFLGNQLNLSEPALGTVANAYSSNGSIRPKQLSKNITAVFRIAARIYLCGLVPGADHTEKSISNLVDALSDAMQFIPAGPDGFDQSLVWPLLVSGSVSLPNSNFRIMFSERANRLGEASDFGSFGRIKEYLREVWLINDDALAKGDKLIHWKDLMKQRSWDVLLI